MTDVTATRSFPSVRHSHTPETSSSILSLGVIYWVRGTQGSDKTALTVLPVPWAMVIFSSCLDSSYYGSQPRIDICGS